MNRTISDSGHEFDERSGAEEEFLSGVAAKFSPSASFELEPTASRAHFSHETVVLPHSSPPASQRDSSNSIPIISLSDSSSDGAPLSEDDVPLLVTGSSMRGSSSQCDHRSTEGRETFAKERGKYERFMRRARRMVHPFVRNDAKTKEAQLKRKRKGSASVRPHGMGRAERNLVSVPVSQISEEVFSKMLSQEDIAREFDCMRDPFPNVPKYIGNPPWHTRYHPDLVKPPTKACCARTEKYDDLAF